MNTSHKTTLLKQAIAACFLSILCLISCGILPVAGMPLAVTRTYDSRDKRVGDFGVGWTLGISDVRIQKNGSVGGSDQMQVWNSYRVGGSPGDNFATGLPPNASEGKLIDIGVPVSKRSFAIQFSLESAVANGVFLHKAGSRNIYSFPKGTTLGGQGFDFTVTRVR